VRGHFYARQSALGHRVPDLRFALLRTSLNRWEPPAGLPGFRHSAAPSDRPFEGRPVAARTCRLVLSASWAG
jgi:hypothetical protein